MNLALGDNNCDNPDLIPILVGNAPGSQLGVDVYLREVRFIIRHQWDADLNLFLRSPSGVEVELSTDNGEADDHYGNPDDSTCLQYTALVAHTTPGACSVSPIEAAQAPFIGSFLPEGNFSDFNDGTDPNQEWVLRICDDADQHVGALEFVELVFEPIQCLPPTFVEVLSVDSTLVELDWTPGSNCSNTFAEYGPPGFTPGTGQTAALGCPPFLLNGLAPSTAYELYLWEDCGGNLSSLSCPVTFQTLCSPPPATLVEDFNTQTTCPTLCGQTCELTGTWWNARHDQADWLVHQGSTTSAQTGPSDDFPGGGRYIYLEGSGSACQNGNEALLLSNCIRVVASGDSCDLSFNYHLFGSQMGSLHLEISTDGGSNWTTLWSIAGDQGDLWHKQFIDLDAYDGDTVLFRFRAQGGNGFRTDMALDNIVFYGSQDLGPGDSVYYFDADQDGFGNSAIVFRNCGGGPPPGFVAAGGDCQDDVPWIFPGAPEGPCDGFDMNCDPDDEYILPPPPTQNDTVCSGTTGTLSATPLTFGGTIHWYDAPTGGNLLHIGNTFQPPVVDSVVAQPVEVSYFAEESNFGGMCSSGARAEARLVVFPTPDLSSDELPMICPNTPLDLSLLKILDHSSAGGTLQFYHAGTP
ncbi:MAG: hypothetical protein D6765_02410, partial [Bacteroidetes bacterium]